MEEERTHISIPKRYALNNGKEDFWRLRLHFMLCDSYSDEWKWRDGLFHNMKVDNPLGFGDGIVPWTFNNAESKWNWLAFQALYSTATLSDRRVLGSNRPVSGWKKWDDKYRRIFEGHVKSIDESLDVSWRHVSESTSFDKEKKEKCLIAEETFDAVDKVGFVNFVMDERISVTCISAHYRRFKMSELLSSYHGGNRRQFYIGNLPSGELPVYDSNIVIGSEEWEKSRGNSGAQA